MEGRILGLLMAALLGVSGTASANRIYFLTTPGHSPYEVFGSITTDGASTPTDSDVVDYKITIFYSGPPSASYTLIPTNSTFSSSGVTASLTGLTLGPVGDQVTVASNLLCPVGGGATFPCYEFSLADLTVQKYFYVVLGFGQTDEVVGGIGEPWASSSLALAPPDILWTGLHFYGTLVAGPVRVGPGVPNLLSLIDAAQRLYDANDAGGTCHSLDAVVQEAREANGARSDNGDNDGNRNSDDSDSAQVIAYARAIQVAIGCADACN